MTPIEIAQAAYSEHRASQRVLELAMAVAEVVKVAPRIVVEIGCDAGGTLFAWRQICGEVYGITLPDNSYPTGGTCYPLADHGATVWRGDSHDPASLAWLADRLAGRPVDVLHIDGDHSYEGVRGDWQAYAPLVRAGGLVLVHDVLNHRDRRVDVPRFWAELTLAMPGRVLAAPSNPLGFGVITIGEDTWTA